jgi:hypothetical protein
MGRTFGNHLLSCVSSSAVAEQRLSRTLRNELFQRVQAAGLKPRDFDWNYEPERLLLDGVLTLSHVPTGFWFLVDSMQPRSGHYLTVHYMPSDLAIFATCDSSVSAWDEVIPLFERWLGLVKAEDETPDLWEIAARAQDMVAAPFASAENNQPFTTAEQTRIRAALTEFRQHVEATSDLQSPSILGSALGTIVAASRTPTHSVH